MLGETGHRRRQIDECRNEVSPLACHTCSVLYCKWAGNGVGVKLLSFSKQMTLSQRCVCRLVWTVKPGMSLTALLQGLNDDVRTTLSAESGREVSFSSGLSATEQPLNVAAVEQFKLTGLRSAHDNAAPPFAPSTVSPYCLTTLSHHTVSPHLSHHTV